VHNCLLSLPCTSLLDGTGPPHAQMNDERLFFCNNACLMCLSPLATGVVGSQICSVVNNHITLAPACMPCGCISPMSTCMHSDKGKCYVERAQANICDHMYACHSVLLHTRAESAIALAKLCTAEVTRPALGMCMSLSSRCNLSIPYFASKLYSLKQALARQPAGTSCRRASQAVFCARYQLMRGGN